MLARTAAKRDLLDRVLLAFLTGNLVLAGVSVFKERGKTMSEDQLLARLEEEQKQAHQNKEQQGN
jgi:hypothetical protein